MARHQLTNPALWPCSYGKVRMESYDKGGRSYLLGRACAPTKPKEEVGAYWGYTTRLAGSLQDVFASSAFEGGYDYKVRPCRGPPPRLGLGS